MLPTESTSWLFQEVFGAYRFLLMVNRQANRNRSPTLQWPRCDTSVFQLMEKESSAVSFGKKGISGRYLSPRLQENVPDRLPLSLKTRVQERRIRFFLMTEVRLLTPFG